MEEVGAAIKEIIQYKTIRGKFSSVHPDLAAEGITRVEVGEEGLHFIWICLLRILVICSTEKGIGFILNTDNNMRIEGSPTGLYCPAKATARLHT